MLPRLGHVSTSSRLGKTVHLDKRCLIIPRTDLDKIYLINLSYSTYSSVGGSTAVARHGAGLNSSEMEAPRIDGVAQIERKKVVGKIGSLEKCPKEAEAEIHRHTRNGSNRVVA